MPAKSPQTDWMNTDIKLTCVPTKDHNWAPRDIENDSKKDRKSHYMGMETKIKIKLAGINTDNVDFK